MALNYVTLTGKYTDGEGNGLAGSLTFTPSAALTDSADNQLVRVAPVTITLTPAGTFSAKLLATDNANLAPAGWGWTVTENLAGVAAFTWSFFLPASGGAAQDIADLAPTSSVVTMAAYMPLPSGTPQAGQVPLATGSGEASAWGTPPGGAPSGNAGGDLGGTYPNPTVVATHLAAALPLAQGGTSGATRQAAIDALTGTQAAGWYLRSDGTHAGLAAIAAADLPIISGQFLAAPTSYAPGSQTSLAISTSTMAAVSSANVNTGNFTVPPSGSVLVTVSFALQVTVGSTKVALGLAAHGTVTPIIGNEVQWVDSAATNPRPYVIQFLLTGLTPAAVMNLDLVGAAANTGTAAILAESQSTTTPGLTAGTNGAPVIMTVQAV